METTEIGAAAPLTPSSAPLSVLHVSDIHFGPKHTSAAAAAVAELVAERRPALVVVSGDLTQRARPEQFRAARQWIDSLAAPALAVPGNHDVPLWRVWERAFAPFGAWHAHVGLPLEPTFERPDLIAVGLNSAFHFTRKDGRLRLSSLAALEERLAAAPPASFRLAVVHHPLVPAPAFESQRVVAHADEAVRIFRRQGVELVLSGHLHRFYLATADDYYPLAESETGTEPEIEIEPQRAGSGLGASPIVFAQSGTTTSSRGRGAERGQNSCVWVEIDATTFSLSALRWEGAGRGFSVRSKSEFPRRRRL